MEHSRTDARDRPLNPPTIIDCGELPFDFDLDSVTPLMEGGWPLWAQVGHSSVTYHQTLVTPRVSPSDMIS